MPSTTPPGSPGLDPLLEALDAADRALRELHTSLAEDPDRGVDVETTIGELHAKRGELARRVGLATLERWRAARIAPVDEPQRTDASVLPVAPDAAEAAQPAQPARDDPQADTPATPPSTIETFEHKTTPVADAVPRPPASDAQIAAFKTAVESRSLGTTLAPAPSPQRPWGISLHEVMCLLGPREADLGNAVALADELDALDEVATPERRIQWVRFTIEVQKHWLAHLVARTRAIREHPASERVLDRLKKIRAVYPQWAREYVPGHVNGLQLKHTPIRQTWESDADDHWNALLALVGPELPAEARKNPPTRKRKERPVVEEEPAVVESDWPLLPVMRGKIALIVGGAPKEPNRDRLETYLRLATLDWPDIDGPRKVEAIAQRVAKGAYDVVIVISTLISHPEAERVLAAAKASRTRWAMAEGFGVTAVRQGLERFVRVASVGATSSANTSK
jgi:hypothetical protein